MEEEQKTVKEDKWSTGSKVAIIVYALIIVGIVLLVLYSANKYGSEYNDCLNQESPYCYMVACPADSPNSTCGGYAKRNSEVDGYVYCSYAPTVLVKDLA